MIELNNFYIGESVNFMRKYIPDGFVDLTVTSPPYDNLRDYKGFIFDYQNIFKELYRVTKIGGVVVWVTGDATVKGTETGTSFNHVLFAKGIGFNLHDTMIYEKSTSPFPEHTRYNNLFEYMFVLSKGKPKTFNPIKIPCESYTGRKPKKDGGYRQKDGSLKPANYETRKPTKTKGNIWRYKVGMGQTTKDKIAFKHPAQFPEDLAQDHIISWTDENDIVLDPMCGAGTTCKMAWLNNRNFIGIDMSQEYINEICIPRLEMYGWKQQNKKINTNI
ncbi:MAG: site-specific DNA-methyltransferase [Methanofastidiosum sp.]